MIFSTECGLMLQTSIPLENIFSHQKLQDCLISVTCSGFSTSARGRSLSQRQRERQRQRQRALLLAHSKPERCGHRVREHLCSSLFHSCLMGGCRGTLPLPFGYHWKVWWAEASFLMASAQPHFLSVHRDVPGCASQQNSRVQISAFVWFPWHPTCFFCCLDVPTFS